MASVTLIWRTMHDERVCKICQALDGYRWTFEVGKDEMTGSLIANGMIVWSLGLGSRAHGHKGNCRCRLDYEYELKDLIDAATQLRDALRERVAAIAAVKEVEK